MHIFFFFYFISECPDPAPENGNASVPYGNAFGELAFIACTSGYVIHGETYITCLENGVWSDNTTCLRGITSINFELPSNAAIYRET